MVYLKGGPQRALSVEEIELNWMGLIRGGEGSSVFKKMWKSLDADGGGTCSLSELECWIVQFYPSIFHKPALKLAFRHSMWVQECGV